MDIRLRKIGRYELAKRLGGLPPDSEVLVPYEGTTEVSKIVKVKEDNGFLYMVPYAKDRTEIEMAGLFGSDMRYMKAGEIADALGRFDHDDVYLQWPTDGDPRTVPGLVQSMTTDDATVTVIAPVPKDIDEISSRVHEIVSESCVVARTGTDCGECCDCGSCPILKDADARVKKEHKKETTNEEDRQEDNQEEREEVRRVRRRRG